MRVCLPIAIVCGLIGGMETEAATEWFPFEPENKFEQGVIGMRDWIEAPAGKRGWLQMKQGGLVFEDGTPAKLWGVNICNTRVAAPRASVQQWTEKLVKYGVNAVRFHKFTWNGDGIGAADRSTELDENLAQGWDFFTAHLKQNGIYTGWSHIYGHRLRPGDKNRVLAFDEVMEAGGGHLKGSTIGLVHFAEDLQNLSIELTVNMLNRTNSVTGQRYADDPALAFIEFQNEDNFFFPTANDFIQACPTYKKLVCQQFSDWLKDKYGSHAELEKAWGKRALNCYPKFQKDEHLDDGTVYPIAHSWFLSPEGLANEEKQFGARRRLLDTAQFLFEKQSAFYRRMEAAIRKTGFQGFLVGSCWQAGSGVPHYLNLYSDAEVGIIDRHNYHGGGEGGHVMKEGGVNNEPMLSAPGSGLLSTGLQQVSNRPFSLSEWMACVPNQWVAEGPVLVAAYGLGLQDWDASFSFASNYPIFPPRIDSPNIYNADSPTQMGLYPALARMVLRGDVKPGSAVSTRHVHLKSLFDGKIGFDERVEQKGDVKSIEGGVPREVLAIGRALVNFSEKPLPPATEPLTKYWNKIKKEIVSTTGQLRWNYAGRGCVTINTPGTQGLAGFAEGQRIQLADVMIQPQCEFAVILVTALDRDGTVRTGDRLLITTVARAENRGMRYSKKGAQLDAVGEDGVMLEAVRAAIRFNRPGKPTVRILDHDGRRTENVVEASQGQYVLDGGRTKALYYEVSWDRDPGADSGDSPASN